MLDDKDFALALIFERAEKDVKGNHRIYTSYRQELEELDLSPKEYEKAVIKLSKLLKV